MTREEKDKAVEILRERLAVQREEIARIEPRLLEYFEGLVSQPSVHSGWEILCAVKFLRLKRTYQFNHKKVRQVIRLREGEWQKWFAERPEVLTDAEKAEWIATQTGVTVGSDAFFPFGDNVERARKSGVCYIAQPGGSVRDDNVIETADKYDIAMCFTGARLFHH